MSAIRDPATITKTGRQMVTAGGDITYTKAVLYGQDISHLTKEQVEGLTSIGDPLVTVPIGISDKNDDGNGTTVVLEATFQNSNLKADLPYKAVGFFAKKDDGDEKLVLVGVATDGAYLAATSPDGVSTDSLDIKIAVAVGDASNVTAVVDPAGSVTPATLNGAISKATHDLTDKINTKADKTDLDSQIGIVTKSVSDLSDTVKANKDDTDKALATKADKATVESDLATKASQSDLDKTNAKVATKADSEDVNAQLATKANSKDVNAALALKDDTADVDDKISNVAKSVSDLSATVTANKKATDSTLATKANASDVADSLATKADKTDVASDVKSLNDAINTKASQADLDKTNAVVATKANATALVDYARTVDVDADLDTKANKTDLESLAKTADVNSALDTKADKATVNSDIKAINDTMATKASQSDLDKTNATVATKADKTTVDGDVKTLQASIDTKADKTALDDYAKSADVASDVKTLTDSIATKADAKTVNDAISKIDFTPYAKSADVDSKLKGYTDTADLTKLLAGKADSDFSYSKAELDKKLLDLTTTTGGKVDASQVATMIENKADKSDVTKQIGTVTDLVNTKANSTDVDAALDKKDDITDVDAKIKIVTDLANTKANSSDVYTKSAVDTAFSQRDSRIANVTNLANQIDSTRLPLYQGSANEDLKGFFTPQIRMYNNATGVKNIPADCQYQSNFYGTLVVLPDGASNTNDGSQILITPERKAWIAQSNGQGAKSWSDWSRFTLTSDLSAVQSALQAKIDAKADASNVYSKSEVDSKTTATIVTGYDIPSKTRQTMSAGVNAKWLVDPSVIDIVADQINQLKGRRTVDKPDFNTLTDGGTYYVTSPSMGKNYPTGAWGTLLVSNGSGHRISQLYFPDDSSAPWTRLLDETTWHNWMQLSTKQDVQNATNLANAASSKVDTVLGNSYFRKQGMNENGDLVEIRGNATKQTNGGYAFDIWSSDWTASKLKDVLRQLPSKANTTDVNNVLNGKANTGDVSALQNKVNVNTPLFREISADSTWEDIFGVTNPNNVLTSLRINPGGSGQLVNDFAAGIGFGGNDTKAVITVDYGSHVARFTAGNGNAPGWSEDVAWKSDINSTNQTVSALQQTIKTLNDTLSSANATIKTLQDTITGLQTQVSNQAQDIAYIKANYIEGKRFRKSQEAQADAWEQQNSQRLAFITDN